MGEIRKPFLVLAALVAGFVVLLELGSALLVGPGGTAAAQNATAGLAVDTGGALISGDVTGRATPYLALLDVVVVFNLVLYLLSVLLPRTAVGRASGAVTVAGAVVLLITAITLLVTAFRTLILMVTLFVAAPFGTVVYLVRWGAFPVDDTVVVLRLLLFLKVVAFVLLLLAQPGFLTNKGLIALIATTAVATLGVVFAFGYVPAILVSIADAAAAVVIALLAAIWAVVLAIGSVPAVIRAIRTTAAR